MKYLAILLTLFTFSSGAMSAIVYVSDTDDGKIFTVSPLGVVSPFVQLPIGSAPTGLAFDSAGNLFVADNFQIDKVTPAGAVSIFASGFSDTLYDLTFDTQGNLFAAGVGSTGGSIFKITEQATVTTYFHSNLWQPSGLSFGLNGDLYVADQIDKLAKITSAGVMSRVGTNTRGEVDVALDSSGNIFTTVYEQGHLDKITPTGTETIFAMGLGVPAALVFDSAQNAYVSDINTGTIFKVTSSGVASSLATVPSAYGLAVALPEPSTTMMGMTALIGFTLRKRNRRTLGHSDTSVIASLGTCAPADETASPATLKLPVE